MVYPCESTSKGVLTAIFRPISAELATTRVVVVTMSYALISIGRNSGKGDYCRAMRIDDTHNWTGFHIKKYVSSGALWMPLPGSDQGSRPWKKPPCRDTETFDANGNDCMPSKQPAQPRTLAPLVRAAMTSTVGRV